MVLLDPRKMQKYMALAEMNRSKLSEAAGIPISTISRIMKGGKCQDITAGKISKALNADFEDLVALWGDELEELGYAAYDEVNF